MFSFYILIFIAISVVTLIVILIVILIVDCRADTAWVLQYSLRRDGANLQTLLSLCSTVDSRGQRIEAHIP